MDRFDFCKWGESAGLSKTILQALSSKHLNNKEALLTLSEDVIMELQLSTGQRNALIAAVDEMKVAEIDDLAEVFSDFHVTEAVDTEKIPQNTPKPLQVEVKDIEQAHKVFFDLESTGLGSDAHITQIAATDGENEFSRYVLPKIPITKEAGKVTGLSCRGQSLYKNDQRLDTVTIKAALKSFIIFCNLSRPCVLIGHNSKVFDSRLLMTSVNNCNMVDEFSSCVVGFVDTLPLTKEAFPDSPPYKQEALYRAIVGKTYDAHDALADVLALQELFHAIPSVQQFVKKHSFTLEYVCKSITYLRNKKENLKSLECLKGVASDGMREKIARSGLEFRHLELVVRRGGCDGLMALFSELCEGKPRVTKSQKIVSEIFDFIYKNT